MKKLMLCVAMALAVSCTRSEAPKEQAKEAPPKAAPAPAKAAPAPAKAEPAPAAKVEPQEQAKIEITSELVGRYLAYRKAHLAALDEHLAQLKESSAKVDDKDPSLGEAARFAQEASESAKKLEAADEKAREGAGLSVAERKLLNEVVGEIATVRLLAKQTGMAEQAKKIEEQMREQMKGMTPEQRAEAEASLKEMLDGFRATENFTALRKKHGDAAVDAVLEHETELLAQQEKIYGVLKKQR